MSVIVRLWSAWLRFWFESEQLPLALEVTRIGLGVALLSSHALLGAHIFALYGEQGLVPWASVVADRGVWTIWTPLAQLAADWQLTAFFGVWVLALLCFTLGLFTSVSKWIVLFGQLAIVHRNPIAYYGLDSLASSLLICLCVAPIGRAWSLDARWRGAQLLPSARAAACVRLIQLQMAICFFFGGVNKVQGDAWWQGFAVWYALLNEEYAAFPPELFAQHFWLINLLTYGTVLLEIGYAYLVWGALRRWLVALAISLHVGIALLMGLYAFSLAMIAGHLAFLREAELRAIAAWCGAAVARARRRVAGATSA